MAERQVIVLGRHSDMSIGWFLRHYRAAQKAGAAAELAASHKLEKYANIDARYLFEPIAVETLGIINTSACHLLNDLGKRMTVNSG